MDNKRTNLEFNSWNFRHLVLTVHIEVCEEIVQGAVVITIMDGFWAARASSQLCITS